MTQKNPLRVSNSSAPAVSGKDLTTQGRDLAAFLGDMVQFGKLTFSGYARFPIALQVPQAPWAIIAVRIVPNTNVQYGAPQGGFCAFAYDAGQGVASVSQCNAFLTASGLPLLTGVIYDFNFLAVF